MPYLTSIAEMAIATTTMPSPKQASRMASRASDHLRRGRQQAVASTDSTPRSSAIGGSVTYLE